MSQNNKKSKNQEYDSLTTGHSWDEIKEYNTPAPRWWLIVWIISIIWSIIYWIFYPTWPTPDGNSKGIKGWTQYSQLEDSQNEIKERQSTYLYKFQQSSFKEIMQDKELMTFAVNGGETAFHNNCAGCHGTGAAGFKGFPNLNDDDWLWGGRIDDIYQTLLYGIRSGHPNARENQMPAFGKDGILDQKQIDQVVQYVMSLSSSEVNTDEKGKELFAANCSVCHGSNAKGNKELGAPNLTDKIWLYGGTKEDINKTIYYSRYGVMPYWQGRLDNDTIRQLTIYIYSLGGGE